MLIATEITLKVRAPSQINLSCFDSCFIFVKSKLALSGASLCHKCLLYTAQKIKDMFEHIFVTSVFFFLHRLLCHFVLSYYTMYASQHIELEYFTHTDLVCNLSVLLNL